MPEGVAGDYERARELIEAEEFEEAEAVLNGILEVVPDHPRVIYALGTVFYHARARGADENEGVRKAEETLLRAIELGPDLAEAHSFLSYLYAKMNRREEASKHIETAIRLAVKSARNWNSIGLYFGVESEYERALDYFLAAYSIDSGYFVAAYNAACAYARLGDTESAFKYLKAGLKSKRLTKGAETDRDFDKIRDLPEFKKIMSAAQKRLGIS
ncbi:MAG: tetratricopeptide repeat protein [Candidatus Coatesbacteria bacterium]|nr:MAG: tetratricopeptide repeat protein [Candidatus Coatesbacteria bacterium]